MTRFISTLASALALSGVSSAHMIMANPKPYGNPNNSPLTGADYPCKLNGDAASFYSTNGLSNTATAGESIQMSFTGSAVHGGGSCQVALTTDMQPTKSTRWSVILSIEGGCPSKDGSSPSTYDVKIPADLPAGDYSYAWTWTSLLSGTQEYYMNCAPLTVKAAGGSRKRSANIRARNDALSSYPPLAVYNLADINTCKSKLSSSPLYPFPGATVEKLSTKSPQFAPIDGTNCFAKGVTYDGPSGGGSDSGSSTTNNSGGGSGSASSNGDSGSAASAAPSSAQAAEPTSASAPSATAAFTGFLTSVVAGPTSAAGAASTQAAPTAAATPTAAASASGSSSSSGSDSSSGSGTSSSGSDSSSGTGSPSGSDSSSSGSSSPPSSSSSDSGSGACTVGEWNCLSGGTTYQVCLAGGTWSTTMAVAAGTECTVGKATSLNLAATASKKRSGLPLLPM